MSKILLMFLPHHQEYPYLWGQPVSKGGVHGIGWPTRAHKAVRVAREGVASGGQAVRGTSLCLAGTG